MIFDLITMILWFRFFYTTAFNHLA